MTSETFLGVPILEDGEWVITGAKTGTIYRKIDFVYPADVIIFNDGEERKAFFRTEKDL